MFDLHGAEVEQTRARFAPLAGADCGDAARVGPSGDRDEMRRAQVRGIAPAAKAEQLRSDVVAFAVNEAAQHARKHALAAGAVFAHLPRDRREAVVLGALDAEAEQRHVVGGTADDADQLRVRLGVQLYAQGAVADHLRLQMRGRRRGRQSVQLGDHVFEAAIALLDEAELLLEAARRLALRRVVVAEDLCGELQDLQVHLFRVRAQVLEEAAVITENVVGEVAAVCAQPLVQLPAVQQERHVGRQQVLLVRDGEHFRSLLDHSACLLELGELDGQVEFAADLLVADGRPPFGSVAAARERLLTLPTRWEFAGHSSTGRRAVALPLRLVVHIGFESGRVLIKGSLLAREHKVSER